MKNLQTKAKELIEKKSPGKLKRGHVFLAAIKNIYTGISHLGTSGAPLTKARLDNFEANGITEVQLCFDDGVLEGDNLLWVNIEEINR